MPDPIVARSPMADVEMRLGIEPIDDLLHTRSGLVEKVATLRAKYGAFGTADHIRKMELARLAGMIRARATKDGRKVTANEIDDESHAHPDYFELITMMTLERADWVRLEAKIDAIEFTIQRGQAVARFVANETRL